MKFPKNVKIIKNDEKCKFFFIKTNFYNFAEMNFFNEKLLSFNFFNIRLFGY